MRDQVGAASARARTIGGSSLRAAQSAYLDDYRAGADVEIDGDPALQSGYGAV